MLLYQKILCGTDPRSRRQARRTKESFETVIVHPVRSTRPPTIKWRRFLTCPTWNQLWNLTSHKEFSGLGSLTLKEKASQVKSVSFQHPRHVPWETPYTQSQRPTGLAHGRTMGPYGWRASCGHGKLEPIRARVTEVQLDCIIRQTLESL